eukprot:gene35543-biopygen23248
MAGKMAPRGSLRQSPGGFASPIAPSAWRSARCCGHGVGRLFHDAPEVVHIGRPGTGPELRPGMIFTIEPMINIGRPDVKLLDDGWTAVTRDRSLSAQFEHSIGITEDGCEIFTASPKGLDRPPYA